MDAAGAAVARIWRTRLRDEARAAGKYDAAISAEHKRGLALGYYIERRESGGIGAFQAKTREEADRVLEETIAKIAAKQAIEKAQKGLQGSLTAQKLPHKHVVQGCRSMVRQGTHLQVSSRARARCFSGALPACVI